MAWNLLFTSDIGLLSLFTIVFMILMAAYLLRYALRHAAEDEAKQLAAPKNVAPGR
ncbi:MAG: DUF3149 domain-containing protein [Accumulibacter sp.]|uniref:DUF3149 domain-containing protein n=1 Tax=Accumulibacter sp. TaxID=2053492 RepID=UPI003315FDAA